MQSSKWTLSFAFPLQGLIIVNTPWNLFNLVPRIRIAHSTHIKNQPICKLVPPAVTDSVYKLSTLLYLSGQLCKCTISHPRNTMQCRSQNQQMPQVKEQRIIKKNLFHCIQDDDINLTNTAHRHQPYSCSPADSRENIDRLVSTEIFVFPATSNQWKYRFVWMWFAAWEKKEPLIRAKSSCYLKQDTFSTIYTTAMLLYNWWTTEC